MNCKICNKKSSLYLESKIFKEKQNISYFKCNNCSFIQTEDPYWLLKAYSSAITKSDIGLISRNIYSSNILENILLNLFPNVDKCLDYAGGYGIFVRIMRDKGFNFYWYDDYCENIFSEHFVGTLSKHYDLITAFEVFEHLPNPLDIIEKLLKITNTLFFSTEITDDVTNFNDWWYRGEISGQHISFYHTETLQFVAKKYNLHYYSFANKTIHLFTKNKINEIDLQNFIHPYQPSLMDKVFKKNTNQAITHRESLLNSDYNAIIKHLNS